MKVLVVCASPDSIDNFLRMTTVVESMHNNDLIPNSNAEYFVVNITEYDKPRDEGNWLPKSHYFEGGFGDRSNPEFNDKLEENGPYDIIMFQQCSIYVKLSRAASDNPFRDMQYARDQLVSLGTSDCYVVFDDTKVHDVLYGGDVTYDYKTIQLDATLLKYFSPVTHLNADKRSIRIYQRRPERNRYNQPYTVDTIRCSMCNSPNGKFREETNRKRLFCNVHCQIKYYS